KADPVLCQPRLLKGASRSRSVHSSPRRKEIELSPCENRPFGKADSGDCQASCSSAKSCLLDPWLTGVAERQVLARERILRSHLPLEPLRPRSAIRSKTRENGSYWKKTADCDCRRPERRLRIQRPQVCLVRRHTFHR